MTGKLDFHPKFLTCVRSYSKSAFLSDLMAGVIVGIVALPLAIAFAIASGVSPEKGIITAVIAGFIVSSAAAKSRSGDLQERSSSSFTESFSNMAFPDLLRLL